MLIIYPQGHGQTKHTDDTDLQLIVMFHISKLHVLVIDNFDNYY